MSYRTLEVELENGRVHTSGQDTLPAKARALLTILSPAPTAPAPEPTGSLAERVADLAGIGSGKFADLSTNPTHLNDFGR